MKTEEAPGHFEKSALNKQINWQPNVNKSAQWLITGSST